jgi:hypothetical protein
MEPVGWLDQEPDIKVMSGDNPDGFDYAGVIRVLVQRSQAFLRGFEYQSSVRLP